MKKESAFPVKLTLGFQSEYSTGLSKRELFAAMAMQGILSAPAAMTEPERFSPQELLQIIAVSARRTADALIAELEKEKI